MSKPKSRQRGDLVLDLLRSAEDVGVVLRDVADAQQAVQRAARLVAVHEPRLGVADRQVAVGAPLVREELHVAPGSSWA